MQINSESTLEELDVHPLPETNEILGWPHMEDPFSSLDVVFPRKGGGERPVGCFRGG